ncbi:hypothetical protein WJX77_004005 [Trebouxia sp. C0004]
MAGQTLFIHRHLQEGSPSAPEPASREASSDGLVPSKYMWAQSALPASKRGLHKFEVVISRYMGRKRAGFRGRSHHHGPRKTASASTKHQESSKPVAGPEGAALALAITAATDIQSAAMHDMLVHVSGNIGQCAEDAMLLQRARHADVLEWLWFLNSRRKPLSDWTRPIHVDLHQTGEVFVLEK